MSPTLFESCAVGNKPATEEGRIFGQALAFLVVGDTAEANYNYPCLFDRLSPTQALGIAGVVRGTNMGSVIQATLDTTGGAFDYYESATTPFAGPPKRICHANDHSMVFRRR